MPIDPKRRAAFDADWMAGQRALAQSPIPERLRQTAPECLSATVSRQGDYLEITLVTRSSGGRGGAVMLLKFNAVAAFTLAGEMFKHLKPLFPEDLRMVEVLTAPPGKEQH